MSSGWRFQDGRPQLVLATQSSEIVNRFNTLCVWAVKRFFEVIP
jgi:hypothetical protein